MTQEEIIEIIAQGENDKVKFKERATSSIYFCINALANSRGGIIIVGVSDEKNIIGIEPDKIKGIKEYIEEKSKHIFPLLKLSLDISQVDNKMILCITVPLGKMFHRKEYTCIHEIYIDSPTQNAYLKIRESGVLNFLEHSDQSELSSYDVMLKILRNFKDWVENNKGWDNILSYPSDKREKMVQNLIHLVGKEICADNNYDMSFEANEGPGPVDMKISRGTDKTVVEIKLSSNQNYLHGYKEQIETYACAEGTDKRIFVYIKVGNPERDKKIEELHRRRMELKENPPCLFIIDARKQKSASKK